MARHRSPEMVALSEKVQSLFGRRLQEIRKNGQRGWLHQDRLAAALHVTRTTISNIERGEHRVFLDQVYAAAYALGVDVSDLLPKLDEVYAAKGVRTSPMTRMARESVITGGEIARAIQQRASEGSLPVAADREAKSRRRR
jgi:transcriptional regulator with XRE-family HTH domain